MSRQSRLNLRLALVCGVLLPALTRAIVDTAWVRRYDGPAHLYGEGICVAIDGQVMLSGV